jgi:hypothetical protein
MNKKQTKTAIKNILVVPKATYKNIMPEDKLDVVFMDYKASEVYDANKSKWSKEVNPSPSEWNVTHRAKGKRDSRRLGNYYEIMEQYPSLFEAHTALAAGGVRQIGSTLVISGQNPMDVTRAYLTGEIPTKNGQWTIK